MKAAALFLEKEETKTGTDVQGIDFEVMMAREQKRIFLLCIRLLRDRYEADSATQDVFLKAHRTMVKRGQDSILEPSKWLTRVALNTCFDRLRSNRWRFWQRHTSSTDGNSIIHLIPATGVNQEDSRMAGDIRERLEKAVDRLSYRQRAVFVLRHEEDRSIEDIAQMMGVDSGTVKVHMARAIKKLRSELRDLYVRPTLE
jgi:RNA polymerase sigma-70 factor, ECF subfamily